MYWALRKPNFWLKPRALLSLVFNWETGECKEESYFHSFGAAGKSIGGFCHFHHFWQRAQSLGMQTSLWDYDLNYLAGDAGKFAHINSKGTAYSIALRLSFWCRVIRLKFLREVSEAYGRGAHEGLIETCWASNDSWLLAQALVCLKRWAKNWGAICFIGLFCFKGLLIQQELAQVWWLESLVCLRCAVAYRQKESCSPTLPYTRSIAHKAGWPSGVIPCLQQPKTAMVWFTAVHYYKPRSGLRGY